MIASDIGSLADEFFKSLPKSIASKLKKTHWGLNLNDGTLHFSIDTDNRRSFDEITECLETLLEHLQEIVDTPIEGGVFHCKNRPNPCGDCDRLGCGIEYFEA